MTTPPMSAEEREIVLSDLRADARADRVCRFHGITQRKARDAIEEQIRQAEQAARAKEFARGFKAGQSAARTGRNTSGCCCEIDDDGETILSACKAHSAWRADERRKTLEEKPPGKWPMRGPHFNSWNADAAKFLKLVQSHPNLWHKNSQLKYLILRVDTREGGHFMVEDRDGNAINADMVMDAIRALANQPTEPETHAYRPDYMAMGDCRVCGHVEDSPLHSKSSKHSKPTEPDEAA